MRKRYSTCQRDDGNCALCSLTSYGRDCQGRNISKLAYLRMVAEMSQPELADASGISIRQIQKYESGDYDVAKMALKNALALAEALGVEPRELL